MCKFKIYMEMKNEELARRIKELRIRKGFSQEELAEKTQLSLRTIQRIENGETEPRGESLKRLAQAFGVTPDDVVDWTAQEDTGFLKSLNLSSLSFILFPLLGILVPLIIWISKKGKVLDIDKVAREILNFQITWVIIFIIGFLIIILDFVDKFNNPARSELNIDMINNSFIWWCLMSLYNIVLILVNTYRIHKSIEVVYTPRIRFIKK